MLLNLFRRFQRQRNFLTLAQAQFIRERIASNDAKEDARIAFERMDDGQAVHALTELHRRRRKGMTLIELLVVVAILLILVTAATTMMNVATDGAEVREAARQVNALFAGAAARAAESNRPAGIWIDRSPASVNAGMEIFAASIPPLYAGDALNSNCEVEARAQDSDGIYKSSVAFWQSRDFRGVDGAVGTADDFVRAGDEVKFNFAGPWHPILKVVNANTVLIDSNGDRPPAMRQSSVPFQIRRGPRKSLVSPLQMPANTCVDLSRSGWGNTGTQLATGTQPVAVIVNPNGSLDSVYSDYNGTWRKERVVDTAHFLIGRVANVGPNNMSDMNCRWVSIGPIGTVITSENLGVASDRDGSGAIDYADARMFAISGKGMGGN